ncbi:MAG: hypothetical protein HY043_15950 [Verrucomicrobia bacterium]|nr:hypothetical protein [Verrucomicrobiota bacterium]
MKTLGAILLLLLWAAACAQAATFQFTAITKETNGVAIQWNSDAGKSYRIESAAAVNGPWLFRTNFNANSTSVQWVDTDIVSVGQRFYRVGLGADTGTAAERAAVSAGDFLPKAVAVFGEQSANIAANAVFLASQLGAGGAQLVTTGTLSQQGQNWAYSPSPNDRLVAQFATGTNVQFYITRVQGDFSIDVNVFLRRPHNFDYRVVTPGVADLTFISDAGTGTPSFQAKARGMFIWNQVSYDVDLTLSGTYQYESELVLLTGSSLLTDAMITGTVRAPGFSLVASQRRRYESVIAQVNFGGATRFDEAVSDQDWIDNTLTLGADTYKWVNATKQKSFKNGTPSSVDIYWQAAGSVLKNGQAYGVYKFGASTASGYVMFYLALPNDVVQLELWKL